jgi:hypothetical protein
MSYSFTARAANRAELLESIREKMAAIAAAQPAHAIDQGAVVNASAELMSLLPTAPDQDMQMTAYGSIGGNWTPGGQTLDRVTSVGFSLTAALVPRA